MSDPIVESFKAYSCFDVGYIEGLTCPMDPEIRPVAPGVKMVGRAFTVNEINAICKNIFDEIGEGDGLSDGKRLILGKNLPQVRPSLLHREKS